MQIIVIVIIVMILLLSVFIRTIVFNPIKSFRNVFVDIFQYLRYRKWNILHTGKLICFVGLFGKGKTLASVNYVVSKYRRYNNKKVYDRDRKKWVTQKVMIISNVTLSNIPYIPFTSLKQVIDAAEKNRSVDVENDTLTITLVLGDEFSVQMNSRNFKSNIDPLFLNTLLTCRHHHISIIYNAQRFGHVDALLRQVTSVVIDCNKMWRVMIHSEYDAWDLENATNLSMIKPLRRYGWFVTNAIYALYDTLACVDNLSKSVNNGDMLTEQEIIALQARTPSDMESVTKPSKRYNRNYRRKVK